MGVAEEQEGGGEVKALSIRQPWASLIVAGIKDVENRTRATKYRSPVLVHAAGASTTVEGLARAMELAHDYAASIAVNCNDFPRSAIIGKVDLVDCVQDHTSVWAEAGAWHWVLANPKAFDTPVPYPGRLGLFDAPDPDVDHLFKPHDGTTRRVCLTQEPCDVVITRPGFWGNPFSIGRVKGVQPEGSAPEEWWVSQKGSGLVSLAKTESDALSFCLEAYESYARKNRHLMRELSLLKGKRLGCFCPPGSPCHGDVLVKLLKERDMA